MKEGILQKLLALSCWLLASSCLFYGCKSHKNITKSVVSTNGSKPIQTIDLPIFIPDSVLQNQLYHTLFAPGNGKYYPCNQPNCDPKFKDIYLENPVIGVSGNLVTIKVHVAGITHVLFVNAGISDDIILTAKPEIQNDTLYFKDVELEHSSQSILLNLTSRLFKNTIQQKIQQYARYSFRQALDGVATEVEKKFPIKYGGAVLLLNLKKIELKSVNVQSNPEQGITVDFSADLETEDSSFAR